MQDPTDTVQSALQAPSLSFNHKCFNMARKPTTRLTHLHAGKCKQLLLLRLSAVFLLLRLNVRACGGDSAHLEPRPVVYCSQALLDVVITARPPLALGQRHG